MSLLEIELEREINPVDMIEHVAATNEWEFERSGDNEINITVSGLWADYDVSLSWMEDFEALAPCLRLRSEGAAAPHAGDDASCCRWSTNSC